MTQIGYTALVIVTEKYINRNLQLEHKYVSSEWRRFIHACKGNKAFSYGYRRLVEL